MRSFVGLFAITLFVVIVYLANFGGQAMQQIMKLP